MALVRICDLCLKMVEDSDYVNIEYSKRFDGSPLGSRITVTLCEDCFNKEFGEEFLQNMIRQYKMNKGEL